MGLWQDFTSGAKQVLGKVTDAGGEVWDATTETVSSGIDYATRQWIDQELGDAPQQPGDGAAFQGVGGAVPGLGGEPLASQESPQWGQPAPAGSRELENTPRPPGPSIPWTWIAGAGVALALGVVGFAAVRGR